MVFVRLEKKTEILSGKRYVSTFLQPTVSFFTFFRRTACVFVRYTAIGTSLDLHCFSSLVIRK